MEYKFGKYDDNFSNNSPEDDIVWAAGGNDTIHMAYGNNTLHGEAGNDSLSSGEGDDYLDGGTGNDILSGGAGHNTYFFDRGYDKDVITDTLGEDTIQFGPEITLDNIRVVAGGSESQDLLIYLIDPANPDKPLDEITDVLTIQNGALDTSPSIQFEFADGTILSNIALKEDGRAKHYGTAGDDTFIGSDGRDEVYGSSGADAINGKEGHNIVNYLLSTEGVSVNLDTGVMTGGFAEGDQLTNIDAIIGSWYDDVLIGDDNDNYLFAQAGNDHLEGGAGDDELNAYADGSDYLDGGEGNDTVRYRWSSSAVTVDLTDQSNNTGDAAGDVYVSIENIMGTDKHSDHLTGDANANKIHGYGGDDTIFAGAGDDTVIAGDGDDVIEGGAGDDAFFFRSDFGNDIITDFAAGAGSEDVIQFAATFDSVAEVLSAASDVGADTVIYVNDDTSITLQNVSVADLHADDFAFF
ncbi:Bifunctional hemolysin/adenylate cyclase precursor [Pseudovibrio sp. Ad13]|uniref:calcium-binding protein n=1 Tax=Pseudovibrio sp. Ad13 TaxID=989396 RepID=UPI0007AE6C89|nr:calcium-binding protein [Pseudovibrio sp. Ad13]KZK85077.1 Bifunctional hemolysin/adenylate cyclase precursor [Pseudovibrio sp. Ad13]